MQPPFPGMDPYLEDPEVWPGFHHHLAEEIMTMLNAQLDPRYFAEVEVRNVLDDTMVVMAMDTRPDVSVVDTLPQTDVVAQSGVSQAILTAPVQRTVALGQTRLRTVQVRLTADKRLVTAIELLSPTNKRGRGLERYRQKRAKVLRTNVHLVEIDLLRGGERPGWEVLSPPFAAEYICLVNRASNQNERISEIWPVDLNQPLPTMPVPLLPNDADIPLNLNLALEQIAVRAAYPRRLDYSQPVPLPALRPAMAQWVQTQVQQ